MEGSWTEDSPDGWTPVVPEGSTYELNVSVDLPPPPARPGSAGADDLRGGRGGDLLDGGLGADTLTGGSGEDSFRFSTEPGDDNVDLIRDFEVGQDLVLLDGGIFSDLSGDGALAFGAFRSNAAGVAFDDDDRILYDTDDGFLSYDFDGSGEGEALRFARLSTHLDLSANDFVVV